MYTDGETFYYRSDRPNRIPDRSRSAATFAEVRPTRGDDSGLVDRLHRLELQAEQLQTTVAQLGEVVQRLNNRLEARPLASPKTVADDSPPAERPRTGTLRAPGPDAEGVIKASVFAGGSATALLGPVRFELGED